LDPDQQSKSLYGGITMAVNCEKVVRDLFAAWTRLNVDEVMSHFAEDAVWDNVPMSPAKGKQAIRESRSIRGEAVHYRVTYYTTLAAAKATCDALDYVDNVVVNRLHDLHAEAAI